MTQDKGLRIEKLLVNTVSRLVETAWQASTFESYSLYVCGCKSTICVQCPQRLEEDFRSLGTGGIDSCELPYESRCKTQRVLCLGCPTHRNTEMDIDATSMRFIDLVHCGHPAIGAEASPNIPSTWFLYSY